MKGQLTQRRDDLDDSEAIFPWVVADHTTATGEVARPPRTVRGRSFIDGSVLGRRQRPRAFDLARPWADDTAEIYELIVERHQRAATVITSNRHRVEWLALMADPLLAHSQW